MTDLSRIRNIGIIAHIDAGKTTTSERILYYTGKEHKIGFVDEGTATMDWMPEEQERGITITSAATTCLWKCLGAEYQVNLIDTPGHVDFSAEVERSLRVLDGAVGIFCAVGGVEPQSETVWRQANKYKVPRLAFVNKLDRVGADFDAVIAEMVKRLGARPAICALPWFQAGQFTGTLDLVNEKALTYDEQDQGATVHAGEIPEAERERVRTARERLVELLAENVDWLTDRYLQGAAISVEEIRKALREVTLAAKLTPVFCGASVRNKGVQPLLDAICLYLPSPLDVPPVIGVEPKSERAVTRKADPAGPLAALAFKTVNDRHGELTYVRVYSGTLGNGEAVYNPRLDKRERIQRLFLMHANQRLPVESVEAGGIAAVVGFRSTVTGDTLCDAKHPVLLEPIQFADTVISMAVEPKSSADKDKLVEVLNRLAKDDPTFAKGVDPETGQTIISGMGELHLEVLRHRMEREFGVAVNVGEPRVAYKETPSAAADGEGKFIKQLGGKGHHGHVILHLDPDPAHMKGHVDLQIREGSIPREYWPAVEEGVRSAMSEGGEYGFPLIYFRVRVMGGSFHQVDSSELAFQYAANLAFKDAVRRSRCGVLEPIMRFDVTVPPGDLGVVLNDLNRRRAEIDAVDPGEITARVHGTVPIAEMFGYATSLRSITQGRGSFSLEPSRYRKVPDHVQKEKFDIV